MPKVTINSMGCSIEVESDNSSLRVVENTARRVWNASRDKDFKSGTHSAVGFQAERSGKRSWLDTGLEGDGKYVRHY